MLLITMEFCKRVQPVSFHLKEESQVQYGGEKKSSITNAMWHPRNQYQDPDNINIYLHNV